MADDTGAGSQGSDAAGSSPAPSTAVGASEASPNSASVSAIATPDPRTAATAAHDQGPIPFDRHKEILESTRGKVRAELEAAYREKYGWADRFHDEPYAFVESWIDQLAQHPQYSQQILAKAARMLASRRGQAPHVSDEPEPDVPVMDAQGQVVSQTFSAPQFKKWHEWSMGQREEHLSARFQPLEEMRQQLARANEQQALHEQSTQEARITLGALRQNPYFKQHEAKIKQALVDHEEFGANVYQAFVHVLVTDILPTLSQTEQRKVVDSLQQKAAASTVNPQGHVASQKPTFRRKDGSPDFSAAMRYYEAHPDEAAVMGNR